MDIQFAYSYSDVRNNKEATESFLETYEQVFGNRPEGCLGCGGNLKIKYNELMKKLNNKVEESTELKVRRRYLETIFSYRDGRRMRRSYGRNMTAEFVKGFIENSDERQIEAFKKIFENYVEPDVAELETETVEPKTETTEADVAELEVAEEEVTEEEETNPEIQKILDMGLIQATKTIRDGDFSEEFLLELKATDKRKGVHTAIDNVLSK